MSGFRALLTGNALTKHRNLKQALRFSLRK
jgi:hypothetical protein